MHYTVNDLSVSLTTPAQVGEHIIIYRQTSTDKIVTWNDGSILLARDMNTEDAQMLHLQEEQQDYIMAHAISTKVTSDKEVLWDALNHRVINVSDPKDPQDAVTKHYMESVQNGFVAANTILVQEATKQASAARVSEQNAAESARVATENAMDFNMLKRNKAYSIGDIAYSSYLPSWARLECVTAGTTADTAPSSITMVSSGGVLISDGTVTWIVDDIRDMTPAGCVRGSLFLPKGYIKANGATVQRADYPRLVHFIESNNLWTDDITTNAGLFGKGDGSSTFVLPDYRERIMQYTEGSIGAKRDAGLPNITGQNKGLLLADRGERTFQGAFIYGGMENTNDGSIDGTNGNPDVVGYTLTGSGKLIIFKFDAHVSNNIYGSSATVQPPAINVIPIIRY